MTNFGTIGSTMHTLPESSCSLPGETTLDELETALGEAQRGDRAAFASLVRTHQAAIYSLSLRMLKDRELARDLAQEVFLQLYRRLADIESTRHLSLWLRKVAANLAIDRIRSRPQATFALLDDCDVEGVRTDDDPLLQQRLREIVAELQPGPRSVVLLRFQDDLELHDIAEALDMPINTVKSHLRRSLAFMKERILASHPHIAQAIHYD